MVIPFLRLFLIWLGFFCLAFVNAAVRELGIKQFLQEPWAHHLSAFTAVIIFGIYLRLMWRYTHIHTERAAAYTGVYWFFLTVLAETLVHEDSKRG